MQDELITQDIRTQYTQVQFITENEIIGLFGNTSKDIGKDSILLDKKNLLLNEKVVQYIFDKIHIEYPVYISIDKDVLSKEQYQNKLGPRHFKYKMFKKFIVSYGKTVSSTWNGYLWRDG